MQPTSPATPALSAQHDLPAICGGSPAITLDQSGANRWPIITAEDEAAVLRVLRSGELSGGETAGGLPAPHPEVLALEAEWKQWLGCRYALACNNGTAAILAGLHAMEIKPGDEVIVPSTTWWSSVLPILHVGGIPVFAETDLQTLALDPADVRSRITPRTRAIIVTHLFGIPAQMDELMAIARQHNLLLMEDASHAHGATYKGRMLGTIGHCAAFSLQANKLVSSAEGGVFVCNDEAMWWRAARLGQYERLIGAPVPDARFAATGFGFKFRMSPLSAAIARVQLADLGERNARRNQNCMHLSERLEQVSGGAIHTYPAPRTSPTTRRVYFEFLVRYDEAKGGIPIRILVKALQAEGALVAAPRYPLLHQQPVFTEGTWAKLARLDVVPGLHLPKYEASALPRTTSANGTLLKLPAFPSADARLLDQYARAFEKVFAARDQLPLV